MMMLLQVHAVSTAAQQRCQFPKVWTGVWITTFQQRMYDNTEDSSGTLSQKSGYLNVTLFSFRCNNLGTTALDCVHPQIRSDLNTRCAKFLQPLLRAQWLYLQTTAGFSRHLVMIRTCSSPPSRSVQKTSVFEQRGMIPP